jgi:hypothetical protein
MYRPAPRPLMLVSPPGVAASYRRGGDWYWEVISDRKNIDRGLAPTKAQARVQARKVAASHAVRQPESLPSKVSRLYRHLEDFDAPLIDD